MTKAIFLDRDGVINKERKDYVKSVEEFQIIDNIPKVIKILKEKGFVVIVITNQSAINRKLLSVETLNKIHEKLQSYLERYDTSFDGVYFCPHTPSENCECRKPKPGLILQAVIDFQIDLSESYMIGNSETDIHAARNAGCKGILLKKDQTLLEVVVDLFESEKI